MSAENDLAPDFGFWLAGFIDGEGCFNCQPKSKTLNAVHTSMVVGLRADDFLILESCRDKTDLGALQYIQQRDQIGRWCWVVASKPDCQSLVAILDRYPLRSKKRRDYEIWRKIVVARAAWRQGQRRALADHAAITHLAANLRAGRKYTPFYEPSTVLTPTI